MAEQDLGRLAAEAVVRIARRGCEDRRCGAEGAGMAGSRAGAARCGECPLDAADKVEDALAASQPQDFGGLDPEHLPEEAVGPWMAQADQDAMLDALARHMAQELDVNVDRARVSLQRLLAKGLLQLKVDPA